MIEFKVISAIKKYEPTLFTISICKRFDDTESWDFRTSVK